MTWSSSCSTQYRLLSSMAEPWCTEPSVFLWRHHLSLQIRLKSVAHAWTLVSILVMNEYFPSRYSLTDSTILFTFTSTEYMDLKKEILLITFTQNVCISTFWLNVHKQTITLKQASKDKEWPFYSPKEKKRRLLFPFSSSFSAVHLSLLSIYLCLSLSLSLPSAIVW